MGGKGGCALWSLGCDEVGTPPISAATLAQRTVRTSQTSEGCWHSAHRSHRFGRKDTFLQPWEDIFLSSGWHRAASLQGRTPSLDPPPVGHIQRVYLVFIAGRNLKIYLKNTGIRAWKLLTSTKSPKLLKVNSIQCRKSATQLFKVSFNIKMMHCPDNSKITNLFHVCCYM